MKVDDEASIAAKKAAAKVMGFAQCVTTAEEEVLPGVTLIEEFPEHFVPVLVPGANDDLAAAVALVSSMVGDEERGEREAEMVVRGTETA
eukprot:gene15733-11260_t